jgi:hypothetical protein
MRSRLAVLSLFIVLTMTAVWTIHAADSTITVYKTTTCGCCGLWVEHLRKNGFQVVVKEVESTDEYAKRFGVPDALRSCHTAIVDGYTIEGHVPAADIQRLLKERPKAKGLAVPGMPMGSPGMEAGGRSSKFAVLLFQEDGKTSVFREYPAK